MDVYACVHVCAHVYVYLRMCKYIYVFLRVPTHVYVYLRVCTITRFHRLGTPMLCIFLVDVYVELA